MTDLVKKIFDTEMYIAGQEMVETGGVTMRIIIVTDNGMGIGMLYQSDHMCCSNCGDQHGKDFYSDLAQTCMVATNAQGYCVVFEGWCSNVTPETPEELKDLPPSQRPDRAECIMVHAESRDRTLVGKRRVLRAEGSTYVGEIEMFDGANSGRFVNLLPKVAPSEEVRQEAQKQMGDFLRHCGYLK
jgi:hypothetical protein